MLAAAAMVIIGFLVLIPSRMALTIFSLQVIWQIVMVMPLPEGSVREYF